MMSLYFTIKGTVLYYVRYNKESSILFRSKFFLPKNLKVNGIDVEESMQVRTILLSLYR